MKSSGQTIDKSPTSDSVTPNMDVIIGLVIGAKFSQRIWETTAISMYVKQDNPTVRLYFCFFHVSIVLLLVN